MRRSCLIGVIVLLTLPCFAWGEDINGIWLMPDGGAVMMRENGGTVIAMSVSIPSFGERYDYCVLSGSLVGKILTLSDFTYQNDNLCGVSIGLTMMLTSPTTGTVSIDYCRPALASSCEFPAGASFEMEKIF